MDPGSRPRGARNTRITVLVTDGRGRPVRAPGLAAWLAGVAPAGARGELAIAIVSDARIRSLNRQFRGRDQPTDVLSFAAAGPPVVAAHRFRQGRRPPILEPRKSHLEPRSLGDVVIAAGIARRQALGEGHSFAVELKVLALHGLLHLLGYDHHDPADGGRMGRLERRLRAKGGLDLGLIERAGRRGTSRA